MHDLARVAILVSGGGGLGGLLYWTSLYLASVGSPDEKSKVFLPTRIFCFAHLFTGMGGAWAVLLATLWGKRASTAATLDEELQLIACSIVAGYAGNRLLPLVADQLTKQLLKDAERNTAKNARLAARSELTSEVYTYLDLSGSQSDHQTAKYQGRLKGELKKHPENRKAAILLARIYAELQKSPQGAIDVLQAFITAKTSTGKKADADVADSYWNIANYYEELFRQSGGSKREYRDAAIDAVEQSIRIIPGYLQNLKADDDFSDFRNDPAAKKKLPALEG